MLVVDVGHEQRARRGRATPTARSSTSHDRELLPDSPADGLVEFDARAARGHRASSCATRRSTTHGPVDAVGISNQRGSTDRVGPRDRRAGRARARLAGPAHDRRVPHAARRGRARRPEPVGHEGAVAARQLDDRPRARDLCFGTVDTWVAWTLSGGTRARDRRDATRRITGMQTRRRRRRGTARCSTRSAFPTRCCRRSSTRPASSARRRALPGAPPIAALVGDQQASLVGQGCVRRGDAKITFGTGGMLDLVLGDARARARRRATSTGRSRSSRGAHGGARTWGVEAVMLAAGTNVQWLRDDLGLIASSDESHEVAAACADTGGVVFVPALLGLGTPAVGLRRARRAVRPDARHRPGRDRARGARRHRAPRRRSRRRRGSRHRHRDRACASTAA